MKDPSHALLTGGVLAAAILAVVGGFLFFANVPEPGAAREQIIAAAPPMNRADIDRIIAERNALAPRPSAVARAESAAGALRSREELAALPLEPMADAAMAAESVETARGRVPGPVETAPADDGAPKSKKTVAASGEALFAEGKYEEALGVWRAAALSGDRVAAYDLGLVYLDSQVSAVPRDATEAAKWLRMAAAANEPRAQYELGMLYERGTGVRMNLAEAASWYLKSAERGHAEGQYNIATMLETGEGIAQDRIEALKFYTLAAEQGVLNQAPGGVAKPTDAEAADPLLTLRQSMPADEVAEAEKRAAAFQPIRD